MAYQQGETEFEDEEQENGEDHAASPRNVGHNIYILAHQVHTHKHTCTYELSVVYGFPRILFNPQSSYFECYLQWSYYYLCTLNYLESLMLWLLLLNVISTQVMLNRSRLG